MFLYIIDFDILLILIPLLKNKASLSLLLTHILFLTSKYFNRASLVTLLRYPVRSLLPLPNIKKVLFFRLKSDILRFTSSDKRRPQFKNKW